MIRQENPNFVASKYAPNPMEVSYWIDLTADSSGNIIKSYGNGQWIPVNWNTNNDQSDRIDKLNEDLAAEVERATGAEETLQQNIDTTNANLTAVSQDLEATKTKHNADIAEVNEELDTKADKATTLAGYGITDAYTKTETEAKATEIAKAECAKLVASAPEALDTLDELSAALGDDPNFATTITNLIGTKANEVSVNTALDLKADKANTYTKNEINDSYYTKEQIDALLANKADKVEA